MKTSAFISLIAGIILIKFGYTGFFAGEYALVREYKTGRERFARRVSLLRLLFGVIEILCVPPLLLCHPPASFAALAPFLCGCVIIPLYRRVGKKD